MKDPNFRVVAVNWRPLTWRDWLVVVAMAALGIAALAVAVVVASTLFLIAVVVGIVAALTWFVGNLLRGPRSKRGVQRYRGNYDA